MLFSVLKVICFDNDFRLNHFWVLAPSFHIRYWILLIVELLVFKNLAASLIFRLFSLTSLTANSLSESVSLAYFFPSQVLSFNLNLLVTSLEFNSKRCGLSEEDSSIVSNKNLWTKSLVFSILRLKCWLLFLWFYW